MSALNRFLALATRNLHWLFTEKEYLKIYYLIKTGSKLNLDNPLTFNEKIQWLKLYDRKPQYSIMVDKYNVKKYVSKLIGNDYIIPTIGVWERFAEIDFKKLPNKFALKTTHDSGGVVICKDKKSFDFQNARKILAKSLKNNFYLRGKEWPYNNVRPQIIAEQYIEDERSAELKDYKIFTFNGVPKYIQVDFDRFINHKRNIYDTSWNFINVQFQYPNDKKVIIPKPELLTKMLSLAKELSIGIPFLRVDFYSIRTSIFFGELTFYPESGFGKFSDSKFDIQLGNLITLPEERYQ